MRTVIDPTPAQFRDFAAGEDPGPLVMLNLLRFRDRADYAAAPDLEPEGGCSGVEAYRTYSAAVLAHLERVGGAVEGMHQCPLDAVIAPEGEQWDAVLTVRYPSRQAFLDMIRDPGYQAIAQHRTAALADARLQPMAG